MYADDAKIVIKQKSGNETILSLESNPVITFEEDYLNVRNDFTNFSFPIADIEQYSVSNTSDINETSILPQYSNGQVSFIDLPQGSKVKVCSLDGKVIRTISTESMGTMTFNLRDLPKGIYVICVANSSFKLVNK